MSDLDSIVKGSPAPPATAAENAPGPGPVANVDTDATDAAVSELAAGTKPGDPLSHTPSSPSMIYLNLLVLEASMRAQYLELRARRRHHTFFLTLLALWNAGFGYALFFAPREDGRGVGGSVYWVIEVCEKLSLMGGIILAILVWATGIWDRGIRWPRRWFAISNRGLRGFNCKLVVVKRPWWADTLSTVSFFLTYGLFSHTASSSYRYVDPSILREVDRELNLRGRGHTPLPVVNEEEERGGHEEDLAPGGDYVKLLLLPKPFSPTFRENWELYRTEYWERENERRASIRAKLKEKEHSIQLSQKGWLQWVPWRRQTASTKQTSRGELEKGHHHRYSGIDRDLRRVRSSSIRRGTPTNYPSRSPTPTSELEDSFHLARKANNSSHSPEAKRKKKATGSVRMTKRPSNDSRSVTPENSSPLIRENGAGSQVTSGQAADGSRTGRSPTPKGGGS